VGGDGTDHDCDNKDSVRTDTCSDEDPDFAGAKPVKNCKGGGGE
jgi:hypothetical protein